MKKLLCFLLLSAPLQGWCAELTFEDAFQGKLAEGWSWLREDPQAWRVSGRGLEVRVQPGNMWGGQNNARNVLLRSVPEFGGKMLEASVTVSNRPSHQYEQADLVWYYDDSHMVKLGQELVDGKLSIVMGREENDKTRTICIIPISSYEVRVRFQVRGSEIVGHFQTPGSQEWLLAGRCDLPLAPGKEPRLSLQFYQGPPDKEHWVLVRDFRVEVRD